MDVRLGNLQPDSADLLNGGLEDAVNVIPYKNDYGSFPEQAYDTGSLSGTCVGAIACRDISGNVYRFAGTPSNLYKLSAGVWNNVSRTTVAYTSAVTTRWRFSVFGNTLQAVNGADAMQYYTLGTSTTFNDMSASASAPVSTFIAPVRDFVMVGNIANKQNRVQWSYINNAARFADTTASVQYQSDHQDLPGEGAQITGITGGDFAAIFTKRSIWRAAYVGTPLVFRFDEMSPGIGCIVPGSIARFQTITYFWSGQGFYAFDGTQAIPIGDEKVDRFFKGDFLFDYAYNVSSVVDPINKLYLIAYPSVNSTDGHCDRILALNYINGRWTRIEHDTEFIFNAFTAGYTLDGLDSVSSSIDALAFSLDSSVWSGGDLTLSGFYTNHRGITFASSNTAKEATFITGEDQIFPHSRAFVRGVRPLVQGDSATSIIVNIGKRDKQTDDVTWTGDSTINSNGWCPVRANARYHRVKLRISGGFERAEGFDIDAVRDGLR